MAATSEPARVARATISFELERFEWSGGRLELGGRWFGVRGMRFVRPTLTLGFADGSSSRALADLEHKPWEPLDGERWQAAFACAEDVAVLDAELAVAPGIAVPLPAPGEELPDGDPIAALPTRSESKSGRKRPAAAPRRSRGGQGSAVPDELAALHEETQRLRQEPIRLRAELDRSEELRKHVEDELERLKMDSDGALARRDAAVGRFEDATAEREEAIRERDAAVQAQNQAVQERNKAIEERDRARAEVRAAAAAREAALAERDRALADRDRAASERDAAVAERDHAATERHAAFSERDAAVARREQAINERSRAMGEREKAIAERDRARGARITPTPVRAAHPVRTAAPAPIFSEDQDQLIKRAAAIAVLVIAGLALLIVLGVL